MSAYFTPSLDVLCALLATHGYPVLSTPGYFTSRTIQGSSKYKGKSESIFLCACKAEGAELSAAEAYAPIAEALARGEVPLAPCPRCGAALVEGRRELPKTC